MPLHIGSHLSMAKGFLAMGQEALELEADTFAFFTRNPRGGRAKPIDPDDVAAFRQLAHEHGFVQLVAHAPYTMNAAAAKENLRTFAREMMADDLERLESLPGNLYNFHPGSALVGPSGSGKSTIARLIAAFWEVGGGSITVGGADIRRTARHTRPCRAEGKDGRLPRHLPCLGRRL